MGKKSIIKKCLLKMFNSLRDCFYGILKRPRIYFDNNDYLSLLNIGFNQSGLLVYKKLFHLNIDIKNKIKNMLRK